MAKKRSSKGKAATPDAGAGEESLGVDVILERLEGVVESLEDGQLPLEEALARFEKGIALVRSAEGQLTGIEQRVEQLLSDAQGRAPFEVDQDDEL